MIYIYPSKISRLISFLYIY